MQSTDDSALLREYTENHSDEAFAALVAKYINLVYSIAIRSIGNSSAAEEITQAVFIIFAQKAGQLRNGKALSSWLFKTTQLTANNFLRSEMRRQRREQEAYDMQTILSEPETELWPKIAPLLDTAVAALKEKDRRAILLRFYEGKNLQEIGTALGVSEVAVEKRVSRAVEKLQKFFFRRGVTSTAKAITATISVNFIQAAPVGLAKTISAVAITKGAVASGSTLTVIKGAFKIMAWTKVKTAIVVGVGILLAAGTVTVTVKEITAHRTPAWQEKFDLSLLDGLPPQVKILPSLPTTVRNRAGGRNGKVLGLGQSFMALLEGAYNVVQSRLIVNAPIPEGKYDFIDTYPEALGSMKALQDEIKKKFGLIGRSEMIETNVLILTVQSPNAPGLKPSADNFSNNVEPGSFSIHGATLYTLVADLEVSLGTVVVDDTKLRGKFDVDLKWDSTPDGLKRVLRDELGLELIPARKVIAFIVVEKP